MTPASSRSVKIAVAASCLFAAGCFAGAVTQRALLGFVLPGLFLGGFAVAVLQSTFSMRSALLVSLGLCLGWAEVANLATGTSNGPAARATFTVGAFTALAIAASTTRKPALFLLPVVGIVVVADLHGAGDEVPFLAVLTCGAAVVALASAESTRRSKDRSADLRRRYWSVAVLALLAMAAASAAVLTQVHLDRRPAHSAVSSIRNSAVRPFWGDPFPSSGAARSKAHPPKPHHAPAAPANHRPPHVTDRHPPTWVLVVLALLVAAALSVVTRLLLVHRAWGRALRSLMVGPPEGMVGAWIWATLRFRAYRMPFPPQMSPDRVARGGPIHEVPPDTAEPLRQLGLLVAPVAFGSPHAAPDREGVDAAWGLSRAACAAAEGSLGSLGRLRVRFVSPGAFGLHLGN